MAEERAKYGTGTVYKQGNSFVAQMYCSIEIDGKTYEKRVTGSGKTETKAVRNRSKNIKKWEDGLRESLRVTEENLRKAEEQAEIGPSLNDVFYMNLGVKDTSVQIPTSDNYETYYEGYVRDAELGKTPIRSITEEQLLEFYKEKRISGRKRVRKDSDGVPIASKPLSISTMNHIRFVINNTFRYAEIKGIIEKNVHTGIPPFKTGTVAMIDYDQEDLDADSDDKDALQRIIPTDDLERILDYAFKHSRLAGLFAWAVNSGMREGECLGLKRRYATPDNDYIFVKKSLTYIKDRRENAVSATIPKLKRPKNGKERKVPYNESLKDIYRYQIGQIEEEKKRAGKLYHDKGLLFADEYGDFLRPWKVLKEFQGILEMLGLEKRRFHDLRHTFISLLIKESQRAGDGISILEVSAIAGHSDPTVTMKIYGGLFPNSTERAMKILDTCNAIKLPALREKEGKSCA